MITQEDLDNWFSYHAPSALQQEKYIAIREAGLEFAETILAATPPTADQTTAIRQIRAAVATANMAIACDLNANA